MEQYYNNPQTVNDPIVRENFKKEHNYTPLLIISILEIVLAGGICGIIALIMVVLADSAIKSGDFTKAAQNLKTAKILNIIGAVLFGIGIIVSIICVIIAIAATGAAAGYAVYSDYGMLLASIL